MIRENECYKFLNDHSQFIGLYLYEKVCYNNDKLEICDEQPTDLRLGFLQNILLLFFSVLGFRYLKMIATFQAIVAKKTQIYLLKIINKTNENIPPSEIEKSMENRSESEFKLNMSSILNDPQEVDDTEIEKDFLETIKYIVLNFLNMSIVDEV